MEDGTYTNGSKKIAERIGETISLHSKIVKVSCDLEMNDEALLNEPLHPNLPDSTGSALHQAVSRIVGALQFGQCILPPFWEAQELSTWFP